jgi:hypothetical protein
MKKDEVFLCGYCDGTGKQTYTLINKLSFEKNQSERHYNNYKELQEYIKRSSRCVKCHGDQMLTFGGSECDECGLPGQGYWPA